MKISTRIIGGLIALTLASAGLLAISLIFFGEISLKAFDIYTAMFFFAIGFVKPYMRKSEPKNDIY